MRAGIRKNALLSVSDKAHIAELAGFLFAQGYQLISTGGTLAHLKAKGIDAIDVAELTHFPAILNGRVKTLSPYVHAGILAKRKRAEHMQTLSDLHIEPIGMVVVNLYPFFENANSDMALEELVEFIDIGGPAMLRAAAKSFFDVTVISDVSDYDWVMEEIKMRGDTALETRKYLAGKAFNLTAAYDAAISKRLLGEEMPAYFQGSFQKRMDLRYGENPHQKAAFYTDTTQPGALRDFAQLQGKALSFNNLRDMDMAWRLLQDFTEPACCGVKHTIPCGVALGRTAFEAWSGAHRCDPISIFGGIVAFNRGLDAQTAESLCRLFLELVAAPAFSDEALVVFSKKKNLRLIRIEADLSDRLACVKVDGGLLVQQIDNCFSTDWQPVTRVKPTEAQLKDLHFAQRVVKHVKSNAVAVAYRGRALGISGGETNRISAAQLAVARAKEKQTKGLVLASDGFFPFRDVVDFAADAGIAAIVQPGGSIRDAESIAAADAHGIPMIFTGMRHFKH